MPFVFLGLVSKPVLNSNNDNHCDTYRGNRRTKGNDQFLYI